MDRYEELRIEVIEFEAVDTMVTDGTGSDLSGETGGF